VAATAAQHRHGSRSFAQGSPRSGRAKDPQAQPGCRDGPLALGPEFALALPSVASRPRPSPVPKTLAPASEEGGRMDQFASGSGTAQEREKPPRRHRQRERPATREPRLRRGRGCQAQGNKNQIKLIINPIRYQVWVQVFSSPLCGSKSVASYRGTPLEPATSARGTGPERGPVGIGNTRQVAGLWTPHSIARADQAELNAPPYESQQKAPDWPASSLFWNLDARVIPYSRRSRKKKRQHR